MDYLQHFTDAAKNALFKLRRMRRTQGSWVSVARRIVRRARSIGIEGVIRQGLASSPTNVDRALAELRNVELRLSLAPATGALVTDEPYVSILMPVYKPSLPYLREAVESIRAQSSPQWQLCMFDDGSNDVDLTSFLSDLAASDSRIRVGKSGANVGIAAASNEAARLATGNYVALVDQDDLITVDAVSKVIEHAATDDPDVIYSDECILSIDGKPTQLLLKPDWSPVLLTSSMYVGHLTCYRTSFFRRLGGFRSEFDFSQDYDLILRASEATVRIAHIPTVLYGWRAHPVSAAGGGKDYARLSNTSALEAALERRGLAPVNVEPRPTRNHPVFPSRNETVEVVIPSDDESQIVTAVESLTQRSNITAFSISVVTNSYLCQRLSSKLSATTKFIPYDRKFNFSAKCNAAIESAADYLVFFNDDVRATHDGWLDDLLYPFSYPQVGVVGPKLLYENGTIQHAGLVTGVRYLIGTAFHARRANDDSNFNIAQLPHEVSAVSGACLAIRTSLFREIGGFDELDFPVSHSDTDLCFRARHAGRTCVYNPLATLTHIGHASFETPGFAEGKRDRSHALILQRWLSYVATDPYFTPLMRSVLYGDNLDTFVVDMPKSAETAGRSIAIVFHELSATGAPRAAFEVAKFFRDHGCFVVAFSPTDGPYRSLLADAGVVVIVDPSILHPDAHNGELLSGFDLVIGNTILCWDVVRHAARHTDTALYAHETGLIADIVKLHKEAKQGLRAATEIWATSRRTQFALLPYVRGASVLGCGVDIPIKERVLRTSGPIKAVVVGSIEPRKGQDIAADAFISVRPDLPSGSSLEFIGRKLDLEFVNQFGPTIPDDNSIRFVGEVSPADCIDLIRDADIIICSSRDEPLSLVAIEAMAMGTIVVCVPTVGIADEIDDGRTGFVAESASAAGLSAALRTAIERRSAWQEIAVAARATYERRFSKESFRNRLLQSGVVDSVLERPSSTMLPMRNGIEGGFL